MWPTIFLYVLYTPAYYRSNTLLHLSPPHTLLFTVRSAVKSLVLRYNVQQFQGISSVMLRNHFTHTFKVSSPLTDTFSIWPVCVFEALLLLSQDFMLVKASASSGKTLTNHVPLHNKQPILNANFWAKIRQNTVLLLVTMLQKLPLSETNLSNNCTCIAFLLCKFLLHK